MAVSKKVAIPATEKKATAAVKVEPAKVEAPKAVVKEEVKAAKEEAPKAAVKKAEPAKKTAAKKETAKKAPAKKAAAKKAELKSDVHIQFDGKSYAQEDLVKIAKDVWKYDLKQKPAELASVELYVKPEENAVYYVMNKEFTGKFDI